MKYTREQEIYISFFQFAMKQGYAIYALKHKQNASILTSGARKQRGSDSVFFLFDNPNNKAYHPQSNGNTTYNFFNNPTFRKHVKLTSNDWYKLADYDLYKNQFDFVKDPDYAVSFLGIFKDQKLKNHLIFHSEDSVNIFYDFLINSDKKSRNLIIKNFSNILVDIDNTLYSFDHLEKLLHRFVNDELYKTDPDLAVSYFTKTICSISKKDTMVSISNNLALNAGRYLFTNFIKDIFDNFTFEQAHYIVKEFCFSRKEQINGSNLAFINLYTLLNDIYTSHKESEKLCEYNDFLKIFSTVKDKQDNNSFFEEEENQSLYVNINVDKLLAHYTFPSWTKTHYVLWATVLLNNLERVVKDPYLLYTFEHEGNSKDSDRIKNIAAFIKFDKNDTFTKKDLETLTISFFDYLENYQNNALKISFKGAENTKKRKQLLNDFYDFRELNRVDLHKLSTQKKATKI